MTATPSTTSPARNRQAWIQAGATLRAGAARGFSLVELLVAMVIGLLVLGVLIDLFISNRRAYQVQSNNNFLQENLRIASDQLGWSLRMSDFWGGQNGNTVNTGSAASAITGIGACSGNWATSLNTAIGGGGGVYGFTGGTSFQPGSNCLSSTANYLSGTDILVLRYADSQGLSPGPLSANTPATASTISSHPNQLFMVTIPGVSSQLYQGKSMPPDTSGGVQHRYAYAYHVDVYYLRPCSVADSSGNCSASSDNGTPLPTLMHMRLASDGTLVSEAVVDGIEQLKFEYGVILDPTTNVVTYKSASDVSTAGQWPMVVSVRASIVAVNPTRDPTVPHTGTYTLGAASSACSYTINAGAAPTLTNCANFTPYGGSTPWQFVRSNMQLVVQLRNRYLNIVQAGG